MIYIEAPNELDKVTFQKYWNLPSIFLAGGISGCKNWQKEIKECLKEYDVIIYNPRRDNFPIHIPEESEKQIMWEYKYLRVSNLNSFWFCKETLNPIVLFELGSALERKDGYNILIGIEEGYKRKQDVEIQSNLKIPNINIEYDFEEYKHMLGEWINNWWWYEDQKNQL